MCGCNLTAVVYCLILSGMGKLWIFQWSLTLHVHSCFSRCYVAWGTCILVKGTCVHNVMWVLGCSPEPQPNVSPYMVPMCVLVGASLSEPHIYCAHRAFVYIGRYVHSDVSAKVNQNGWRTNPWVVGHVCVYPVKKARSRGLEAVVVLWRCVAKCAYVASICTSLCIELTTLVLCCSVFRL